ncbi:glycosyltransferase [Enterococcus faecalis]
MSLPTFYTVIFLKEVKLHDLFVSVIQSNYVHLLNLFIYKFISQFSNKKKTRREVEVAEEFFCYFLVPCVNEEKVIGETLKKLVALPIKKKIIAIDDGSTDQTKAMMDSIAGQSKFCLVNFPMRNKAKEPL